MINYRKPNEDEFIAALNIINEARKPYKALSIYKEMDAKDTTLDDLINNEQKRDYRVLTVDDDIVGFCAFRKKDDHITWLSQFYIDPKYQKQGLGKKFLKFVEEEVSELSDYIVLEYWPDATWARDFYLSQGYVEDKSVFESKSQYTKVLVKRIGARPQ